MKYLMVPMWFANFLEKETDRLTRRETRCLKVQLNRSIWLVIRLCFLTTWCYFSGITVMVNNMLNNNMMGSPNQKVLIWQESRPLGRLSWVFKVFLLDTLFWNYTRVCLPSVCIKGRMSPVAVWYQLPKGFRLWRLRSETWNATIYRLNHSHPYPLLVCFVTNETQHLIDFGFQC